MKSLFLRFLFPLVCLVAISLGVMPYFQRLTLRSNPIQANEHVETGEELSKEQAQQLEQALITKPHNTIKREKLIRYYWKTGEQQFCLKHILWLIHNHPEAQVLLSMESMIFRITGRDKTVMQAWDEEFQKHPNSIAIVKGYVEFLSISGYGSQYKTLCEKGQILEPKKGIWSARLAQCIEDLANKKLGREQKQTLKLALDATNTALSLENSPHDVIRLKEKQADLALLLGDYEKARILTEKMLTAINSSAPKQLKGTSVMEAMREDILNHSHVRLGRIALRKNDVRTATQELLAARPFSISETLVFFGYHMALAKELLEKGESATVLQYFEQCRHLPASSFRPQDFNKWASEVKRGKIPNFGTDMVY